MSQVLPSSQLIQEQLNRILSHEIFKESPTLQRLLTYIVQETQAGNQKDLKEYTLGVSVFKRSENFDPRTDSIARVQVGVLRKKLSAYYSGPGQKDEVLIDVPRGHYAAEFSYRVPDTLVGGKNGSAFTKKWFLPLAFGFTGILLGSAFWIPFGINGRTQPSPSRSAMESPWREHPIWKGFFEPESSTQLVVGAPMFVAFGGTFVRDSAVNTMDELARSGTFKKLGEVLQGTAHPEEIYTGLGEASGLYTLGRFFHLSGKELPLIRNRLTRWQDVAHSNLILLSSFRFRTFNQELDLPGDFEFDMRKTQIRNLKPGSGEQTVYVPSMSDNSKGHDFALVSVWPSPQSGRKIMAIQGAFTWGTQGAADYVVDPLSLKELDRRLKADQKNHEGEALQILLKVLVKDHQPIAANYVTHHWLAR